MSCNPALIAAIADPGIGALASVGCVRSYPKHSVVISDSDVAGRVFVILSGRVRVFSSGDDASEVVLDVLGPVQLLAEMSLDGSPRSASVMTMGPTLLAVLDAAGLRERLKGDVNLAMLLVTSLLGGPRHMSASVKQLALGDVYERLGVVLTGLQSAAPAGEPIDGMTQQNLATRIGSSRDMVNRIFRELEKGGYLEVARRRTRLLKPLPKRW